MKVAVVCGSAIAVSVAGCGSITAVQLDAKTLRKKDQAAEGILYYMPKPHLLVAMGPPLEQLSALTPSERAKVNEVLAKAKKTGGDLSTRSKALSAADKAILIESVLKASAKDDGEGGGEQSGTAAQATTGADTASFSVGAGQYLVKLIYLPDCARPMALKVEAGLFGKVDAQPRLENGWMLTSLEGKVDNSTLLAGLAGVITANKGSPPPTPAAGSTDGATTSARGDSTPSVGTPFPSGLHPINCDADKGSTIKVEKTP